jgi:hypothetical protein
VPLDTETDPRFPSGRWMGFFVDRRVPGRHHMELLLTFRKGDMTGEGRDRVGAFVVRGRYTIEDGRCHWTKRYLGRHDVFYSGYNEGKGIWGIWTIAISGQELARGGFHIWPEGMLDPSGSTLSEAAEVPVEEIAPVETAEPVAVPG